ncbi:sugar transferase [Loigolactobacillus bifermentans]|uniref:sugar transferase n=1 Tax=Loigolactobacillus bifermentans TaxID=1607 RepID=UPI00070D71BB|nr:sugar transferase [Loigolactobacillus bifermentans]QGG61675.1 hypothetical protein LB003_15055 [Loigolactobacillus bifermentans]
MNKYVINILQPNSYNAMSKAKDDVNHFLNELNFQSINVRKFKNKFEKFAKTRLVIDKKFGFLQQGDILLMQFPTYLGRRFERKLITRLKQRHVKLLVLVHDLDILRFSNKDGSHIPTLKMDVEDLNEYDVVISSNSKMTELLQKNGLKRPVVDLEIFDYYYSKPVSKLPKFETTLNFAGNLKKSEFLYDFSDTLQTKLRLFGLYDKSLKLPKQSEYCGIFTPEDLIIHLDRGFGLVWDGLSSKAIEGKLGNYLKYNNPHKTSLYLASGLPIVMWSGAALSSFISENHIGILIESLDDIDQVLEKISEPDYIMMARNAQKLSEKITSGYFVKNAVNAALSKI